MPKINFFKFSLIYILFFSCKKTDIDFGSQFLDKDYTEIIKTDTFSVEASTIYIDSFVTSGSSNTLIGGYSDPFLAELMLAVFLL